MKYNITQEDKNLLLQTSVEYKYKLLVVDNNKNVIDELVGISSVGSYSISSESDIRRTTSFTLLLDNIYRDSSVEKKLFAWIGYNFKKQIGIYSIRLGDYKWFNCGDYMITAANTSYNATNNSLTVSLSDWYSKLNGIRNGQTGGAPIISIPNVDVNGNPVTIKKLTEDIIIKLTDIKDYIIDDIGEFYCMPQNNPLGYQECRKLNPQWNQLPYDLEYNVGCHISEVLEEIKNLYPNCQMYFDIYGNFCFNLIPSCEYEPITLDDEYIQQILLADDSENVTYDIEGIKNVTEVFGHTYEIDRYSTECSYSNDVYILSLESYDKYSSGDMIAFIPTVGNVVNSQIKINELDVLPLYHEHTTTSLSNFTLESGKTYVIQIKKVGTSYVAYYLGQYQPHALCVLTNNANDTFYTKEYFTQKYNCSIHNIVLRVEEESPFAVQKIGEVLDVKTGDEFDNILSDSVAVENAIYYNKKSSSVHDTVTISTKMIPFLDTNIKIKYRKQQEKNAIEYIVKSVDNDMSSCTSRITMYRFYPLYFE